MNLRNAMLFSFLYPTNLAFAEREGVPRYKFARKKQEKFYQPGRGLKIEGFPIVTILAGCPVSPES